MKTRSIGFALCFLASVLLAGSPNSAGCQPARGRRPDDRERSVRLRDRAIPQQLVESWGIALNATQLGDCHERTIHS